MLNLNKLGKGVTDALKNETAESLNNWISKQMNTTMKNYTYEDFASGEIVARNDDDQKMIHVCRMANQFIDPPTGKCDFYFCEKTIWFGFNGTLPENKTSLPIIPASQISLEPREKEAKQENNSQGENKNMKYFSENKINQSEKDAYVHIEKENPKDRKIIGYKVPFDVYGDGLPSGCTITRNNDATNYWHKLGHPNSIFCIPDSIVTTFFEPVYEEQPSATLELTIGDNVVSWQLSQENIKDIHSLLKDNIITVGKTPKA